MIIIINFDFGGQNASEIILLFFNFMCITINHQLLISWVTNFARIKI